MMKLSLRLIRFELGRFPDCYFLIQSHNPPDCIGAFRNSCGQKSSRGAASATLSYDQGEWTQRRGKLGHDFSQ
jgi:hypothetical protein